MNRALLLGFAIVVALGDLVAAQAPSPKLVVTPQYPLAGANFTVAAPASIPVQSYQWLFAITPPDSKSIRPTLAPGAITTGITASIPGEYDIECTITQPAMLGGGSVVLNTTVYVGRSFGGEGSRGDGPERAKRRERDREKPNAGH